MKQIALLEDLERDLRVRLQAIQRHADRSDHHRLGAKRLAAKLLEEIDQLVSTRAG